MRSRFRTAQVAERQVLAWLQPKTPALFKTDRFPIFIVEVTPEERYYGFPVFSVPGVKFGLFHHLHEHTTGDAVDREMSPTRRGSAAPLRRDLFPARRRS